MKDKIIATSRVKRLTPKWRIFYWAYHTGLLLVTEYVFGRIYNLHIFPIPITKVISIKCPLQLHHG